MTSTPYIIGLSTVTMLSFAAFVMTLFFVDPTTASLGGKSVFYISAFAFLFSVFSLTGLLIRKKLSGRYIREMEVGSSMRHALLLSLLAVGLLFMQSIGAYQLHWALIALGAILLVEYSIVVRRRKK